MLSLLLDENVRPEVVRQVRTIRPDVPNQPFLLPCMNGYDWNIGTVIVRRLTDNSGLTFSSEL